MAGVWIERRNLRAGGRRYIVRYRLGGAEAAKLYGGSFRTRRDAEARERWIAGELAAMRVPDLRLLQNAPSRTLAQAAEGWLASRIDLAPNTLATHRKSIARAVSAFGQRDPASLIPPEIAEWVSSLAGELAPATIGKSLGALAQLLDHLGVDPNPARDRRVRLPRRLREEIEPPTAEHVERVIAAVAPRYRLALVVLESTAMRVSELESLTWGDVDVPAGRWRVARQREKAARGRWVAVPPDVFAAVDALVPREDRATAARVFPLVEQARLRAEINRACRATGTPAWSPHDLRHRRISLWHRQGIDWARIGAWAGQSSRAVTADVYTHALVDDREVDRAALLR